MPTKTSIGFIGLGLMGQAFTKRLVAAGYTVTGFDIAAEKIQQATRHGVVAATSSADVTGKSDVVLLCVVSTDAVHEAVFGSGGVVESASADKLLVDHSTTIMESTKTMADTLRERSGMGWVDAPVSGGPPAAEAGTLAIMAGGVSGGAKVDHGSGGTVPLRRSKTLPVCEPFPVTGRVGGCIPWSCIARSVWRAGTG